MSERIYFGDPAWPNGLEATALVCVGGAMSEHDRSMGILQQADEERARRKDNPDTWEERKARLERRVNVWPTNYDDEVQCKADIRAALERIEERETTECREILHLRQRVEELERDLSFTKDNWQRCATRAEAAEASAAHLFDQFADEQKERIAAEAKLARCVEALLEIKGRALASQTHEIGPLEAKERLAAVLVSARAALAAAKGE